MGIFEGVARKLNPTGLRAHSAGRKAEDGEQAEGEHTRRSSGGAGGATPRRPRWVLSVRWYAELVAVAKAERAAKTHDLSEGTEPVVCLCSRRSEKEP
jgi:hypothetical protein